MSNILILPQSGIIEFNTGQAGISTVQPGSSGVRLKHEDGQLGVVSYNLNNNTRFYVEGNNGRLFSIIDSTTGDLLSIQTLAGTPVLSVNNSGVMISGSGSINGNFILTSVNSGSLQSQINNLSMATGIIQVDSIKSLKGINTGNLLLNTIAIVRSYYDDTENFATAFAYRNRKFGGGRFYWNPSLTSAQDSGLYIRPNSVTGDALPGRWERLFAGEIPTPQMWGAKGDAYQISNATSGNYAISGSDDTLAIQAAMDACSFGSNGILRFPSAWYKITDTLLWNTQQTTLVGDGVTNNTAIIMDIGINKDMFQTTTYHNYVFSHNESPTIDGAIALINNGTIPFDQMCMKNMSLRYGGNAHNNGGSAYLNYPQYRQNTGNSCLVVTQPGEVNTINDCLFQGGKHAIKIVGVGAPGIRTNNLTLASYDSNYCIEPIIFRTTGVNGQFTGVGGEYIWRTGAGAAATMYLNSNSSDQRGLNSGAFSFIKIQNGAVPKIFIENLKLEGYFTSGVINYQKPSSSATHLIGSIQINGLTWNGDDAIDLPQNGVYDQNVIVLHSAGGNNYSAVDVSIKDANLYGVKNIINDSIAKGGTGESFIYETPISDGNNQQNLFPEINYNSRWLYSGSNGNNYSQISLRKNGRYFTHLTPTRIGWYRVARSVGNSPVNMLNHDFTIGHSYEGVSDIRARSYGQRYGISNLSLESSSSFLSPSSYLVSRARLFTDTNEGYIAGFYPNYLDVYVANLPDSETAVKHIEISCDIKGYENNIPSPLITPFYLGSGYQNEFYRKKLSTSVEFHNYAEVDLTKPVDKSHSDSETILYNDNILINKDVHLFTDNNGNIKVFDAGSTVTFSGGGYSTQAQGQPVFVNGKLVHIVLTNTGAGYSSSPTILITPRTNGNGSGAYASGAISNGISYISIISGGDGYGKGPLANNSGYSFYVSSNPSGYIGSLNNSGAFPSTANLVVPVSIDIYGETSNLMGRPAGFMDIYISGILRKLPYY